MRIAHLQRLILGGLALIWASLFSLQILQGPRYLEKSEKNRTRLIHLPAARGSILDRNGVPLVEDELTFELAVLPQELKDPDATWANLSAVVNIPPAELARRYRKRFEARFSPVALFSDLPRETAFRLEEERAVLPGVMVRPIPQRRYRQGPAVAAVAGYLGLIAPEELTHLRPYGYTFRDRVGKDGLEKRYDSHLRGRDGGLSVEVNARGNWVQPMRELPPRRGRHIVTTIDHRLQGLCHELLGSSEGAIVVMEAGTGEILALASAPGFDPNAFLDPERQAEIRQMLRDPGRPMFNRAIRAEVPPGSTFKPAVAYAALREGKILADTALECPGRYLLGRTAFRCWQAEGHGPQTVVEALEHSCNVFFYQVGRRLGAEGIARAARGFHLGQPTGIDLPGEAKGLVPDPDWMRERYRKKWQEGDTVSYVIGQGPLLVTPLQMLALFTAIGKNGALPRPHLLRSAEPEGAALKGKQRTDHRMLTPIAMDPRAAETVQAGLEGVVSSETGTGRLARLPGVRVAAKTGTSQVAEGAPHAWFCGYAPAGSPKVSFVVFLEHGGRGGFEAAQIAGQLLAHLKELSYL